MQLLLWLDTLILESVPIFVGDLYIAVTIFFTAISLYLLVSGLRGINPETKTYSLLLGAVCGLLTMLALTSLVPRDVAFTLFAIHFVRILCVLLTSCLAAVLLKKLVSLKATVGAALLLPLLGMYDTVYGIIFLILPPISSQTFLKPPNR